MQNIIDSDTSGTKMKQAAIEQLIHQRRAFSKPKRPVVQKPSFMLREEEETRVAYVSAWKEHFNDDKGKT